MSALARHAAVRRRLLCTAVAVAEKPKDTRPFFIRNWGTSLVLSFGGSWAFTLWVSNKSRKATEAVEEEVKARMPLNSDELLELRALNDAPASAIASLPARAAAAGCRSRASGPQLLSLLRDAVAAPGVPAAPLKEEYALERMLMALPDRDDAGTADVRLATGALAFLSSGTVHERMETIYQALGGEGRTESAPEAQRDGGVPTELLAPLLRALVATGQVPPDKVVRVEEHGKNPLGIERSWYQVASVREYTAEDWVEALLEEHYGGGAAASGGADTDAGGEALDAAAGAASARAVVPERIELATFIEMLQSNRVCLWGECFQIVERRKLARLKEEADELVRNPPWYRRVWNVIAGGGGEPAATPSE